MFRKLVSIVAALAYCASPVYSGTLSISTGGTGSASVIQAAAGGTATTAGTFNVLDYGASGSAQHTTNTGGLLSAGSSVVVLTSALDFKNGQGIYIVGAGPAGGIYFGHIVSGGGSSTLTISPPTSTLIGNGQETAHADGYGINAAQDACETAGGGVVYFPPGTYRVVDMALHSHHLPTGGTCAWIGASSTSVNFAPTYGNGPGSQGPQAVFVGTLTGYIDPAFIQFGTKLLTGNGNSYSPNGLNEQWLNFRDGITSGEYNNATAFTAEATYKVTGNPSSGLQANIINSGGQITSDDRYNSAFTLTLKNTAGTTNAYGSVCLSKQQSGTFTHITAWSITSNVATFTATNSLTSGQLVRLGQFGSAPFFNEQIVTVLSSGLSGSQFKANFTHGNASASETAIAIAMCDNTTYHVTATTPNTTGANHHVAITYDGANVKLWFDGNSEGTPVACASCFLGQDRFENVTIGAGTAGFMETAGDSVSAWPALNGSIDAPRISDNARYTSNFTPPTAKWAAADSHTYIQCNFDNQQDVFTVCQSGKTGNGNPVEPVWLPIHRTDACGSGFQENYVKGINFSAMDGLYISGTPNNKFEDFLVGTNHNGMLWGQCTYNSKIYDAGFASVFAGYNLMSANGLTSLDTVQGGGATVPFKFASFGTYSNLFVQASQGTMISTIWGDPFLPGGTPVINASSIDCEATSDNFRTNIMLDSIDGGSISGGIFDSSCMAVNTPPVSLHSINGSSLGGSAFVFNGDGFKTTTGELAFIHMTGVPPTEPLLLLNPVSYGVQPPQFADRAASVLLPGSGLSNNTDPSVISVADPRNSSTHPFYTFPGQPTIGFYGDGAQGISSGVGRLSAARLSPTGGTATISSKLALSAAWGSTASITNIKGGDQSSIFTITPGGTGITSNPTITWTFSDGTWTNSPICTAIQNGGNGAVNTIQNTTESATAPVFTYNGTPVSGSTYRISIQCWGSQN